MDASTALKKAQALATRSLGSSDVRPPHPHPPLSLPAPALRPFPSTRSPSLALPFVQSSADGQRRRYNQHLLTLPTYHSQTLNEYYAKSISRDFSEFEEYQDQAVDAILDLCEDENEQVGPHLLSFLSSLLLASTSRLSVHSLTFLSNHGFFPSDVEEGLLR